MSWIFTQTFKGFIGGHYNRNQDYTVYIKYTARPNEVTQKGSAAISEAKGLYFINPQGKEEGKLEIAKNMQKENYPIKEIAKITKLDYKTIEKLK